MMYGVSKRLVEAKHDIELAAKRLDFDLASSDVSSKNSVHNRPKIVRKEREAESFDGGTGVEFLLADRLLLGISAGKPSKLQRRETSAVSALSGRCWMRCVIASPAVSCQCGAAARATHAHAHHTRTQAAPTTRRLLCFHVGVTEKGGRQPE